MATLEITLEDEHGKVEEIMEVPVPDGPHYIRTTMRRCLYCLNRFMPMVPHQQFCDAQHQVDYNSEKRPRKTERASSKKKRSA